MSATVDITLDDLYTSFGNFLQGIIGIDPNTSQLVPVVQGQPNRVPMPSVPFMLMQGMVAGRSSTNLHQYNPTIVQPVGKYGTASTMQKTRVKMQVDFYGPQSENWATVVSTLLRDEYGCTALAPTCQPLYSDEPFQGALVNGEEQYEDRWTLVAYVQYNPVTTTAQQFAEALAVTVINVDERYQ